MIGRSKVGAVAAVGTAIVALVAVACGGASGGGAVSHPVLVTGHSSVTTLATEASNPSAVGSSKDSLTIEGGVVVLTDSYGLPGTTGYDTLVVFHVRNSANQSAVGVPVRVTVLGGGKELTTTSGTDTVTVAANSTRLVVLRPDSPAGTRPDSAKVTLYSDSSFFNGHSAVSDSGQWEVSNIRVACSTGSISCNTTGDLKWTGNVPESVADVQVAWRTIAGEDGSIIGAGREPIGQVVVNPGQTVPFAVSGIGFVQPKADGVLILPNGPLAAEVYVESSAAGS